tara:strand:+ start:14901 stop:15689 length:789 start_codon:yes stop_codon:yes gene_type:complete
MAMLFPQLIKANLKTLTFGRTIEYYQRLESTNLEAFELISADDSTDGMVVITDMQYQGKGRRGRSWFASPGKAVTFSVILRLGISTEQSGLLSLAAGAAVAEALSKFGLLPVLKWPNDIRLSGKKCGGVLVETQVRNKVVEWAVIGIGINVNEQPEELPEELRAIATTLSVEKGAPIQRELVVAWTLNALEPLVNKLVNGNGNVLRSAWLERCDHLKQSITFNQCNEAREGTFAGITENGEAVIETAGKEVIFTGEEISLII